MTLHGVPYSPPYEIVGIGAADEILASLEEDSYLDIYREYAADPTRRRRATTSSVLPRATAPAYEGLLDLTYATPMATPSQGDG